MDRASEGKTGLIYANARYLDPDTGRFLSFDPFEGYDDKPISLHRYLYVYQNPLRYVDLDGESPTALAPALEQYFVVASGISATRSQNHGQEGGRLIGEPGINGPTGVSGSSSNTGPNTEIMANLTSSLVANFVSFFVTESPTSPSTELVHDVPERGSDFHPADTDFDQPKAYEQPVAEALPTRMETPYHGKTPEEFILATPSRGDDIDSGPMLSESSSDVPKNASALNTIKRGSKEWDQAVKDLSSQGKGKSNVRTETATEAKALLTESRGNMNRYKNYAKDKGKVYSKGYETHNSQNPRELGAGNDLQHLKWKDGKSGGHIFYDSPN